MDSRSGGRTGCSNLQFRKGYLDVLQRLCFFTKSSKRISLFATHDFSTDDRSQLSRALAGPASGATDDIAKLCHAVCRSFESIWEPVCAFIFFRHSQGRFRSRDLACSTSVHISNGADMLTPSSPGHGIVFSPDHTGSTPRLTKMETVSTTPKLHKKMEGFGFPRSSCLHWRQ